MNAKATAAAGEFDDENNKDKKREYRDRPEVRERQREHHKNRKQDLTSNEIDDLCKEMANLVSQINENMKRIGEICVQIIDSAPDGREQLQKRLPRLGAAMLRRFEAVGRGSLHPKLGPGTPYHYAGMVGKMPLDVQEHLVTGGAVSLLTASGDELMVTLDSMQADQARQVFASDHVRTLAEQRALIEADIAKLESRKKRAPAATPNDFIDRQELQRKR